MVAPAAREFSFLDAEERDFVRAQLSGSTYTVKEIVQFIVLARLSAKYGASYGPAGIAHVVEQVQNAVEQIRRSL